MRLSLGSSLVALLFSACGSPSSPAPVVSPSTTPLPATTPSPPSIPSAHVFEMPTLPFSFAVPAELAARSEDERTLYARYSAVHAVDGGARFEASPWPYGETLGLDVVRLVATSLDAERSFGTLLVHREGDFRFVVVMMLPANEDAAPHAAGDEGAELAIASCDAEGRAAWQGAAWDDEQRAALASRCRSLVTPAVASLLLRATGDSMATETRAFAEMVLAFANPPSSLAEDIEPSAYRFRRGARFVPFHVTREGDTLHVTGTGSMPNQLESLRLEIEPERITLRREPMAEARSPTYLQ